MSRSKNSNQLFQYRYFCIKIILYVAPCFKYQLYIKPTLQENHNWKAAPAALRSAKNTGKEHTPPAWNLLRGLNGQLRRAVKGLSRLGWFGVWRAPLFNSWYYVKIDQRSYMFYQGAHEMHCALVFTCFYMFLLVLHVWAVFKCS